MVLKADMDGVYRTLKKIDNIGVPLAEFGHPYGTLNGEKLDYDPSNQPLQLKKIRNNSFSHNFFPSFSTTRFRSLLIFLSVHE